MADAIVEPEAFFGVVRLPAACHWLLQEGTMGDHCLLIDRLNLLGRVAHTVSGPLEHNVEAGVLEYSDGFLLLDYQVNPQTMGGQEVIVH